MRRSKLGNNPAVRYFLIPAGVVLGSLGMIYVAGCLRGRGRLTPYEEAFAASSAIGFLACASLWIAAALTSTAARHGLTWAGGGALIATEVARRLLARRELSRTARTDAVE
jgi:hypothetical protein